MNKILSDCEDLINDRNDLTLAEAEFMEKHPIIGWGGFMFKWFSIWVTITAIIALIKVKFQEEEI